MRGRVGVGFDRIMPYATGGLAFVDNSIRGNGNSDSSTEMGLALGAGGEGRITDRLSAKVEYMYLGTGESGMKLGNRKVDSDLSTNTLRAGIGYRF